MLKYCWAARSMELREAASMSAVVKQDCAWLKPVIRQTTTKAAIQRGKWRISFIFIALFNSYSELDALRPQYRCLRSYPDSMPPERTQSNNMRLRGFQSAGVESVSS